MAEQLLGDGEALTAGDHAAGWERVDSGHGKTSKSSWTRSAMHVQGLTSGCKVIRQPEARYTLLESVVEGASPK